MAAPHLSRSECTPFEPPETPRHTNRAGAPRDGLEVGHRMPGAVESRAVVLTCQPQTVEVDVDGSWSPGLLLGWGDDGDRARQVWVRVLLAGGPQTTWTDVAHVRVPGRHLAVSPQSSPAAEMWATQKIPAARDQSTYLDLNVGRRTAGRRNVPTDRDFAAGHPRRGAAASGGRHRAPEGALARLPRKDVPSEVPDDCRNEDSALPDPAGAGGQAWRETSAPGGALQRYEYREQKRRLQVELLKLQSWVKESGTKIAILLEGRDASGKGGTIKRFTQHLNPRGTRVVALSKPTDLERTQWYFQRYVQHMPSAGEIVLLDRSWYNRAGVERVMGYCTPDEYQEFMRQAPEFERMLARSGIHLFKLWLSVSRKEQRTRFTVRRLDPVRQWKLSPTDLASLDKWDAYTEAKEAMFAHTNSEHAPWTVIKSDDKKRARLEVMRHVLGGFPYTGRDDEAIGTSDPLIVGSAVEVLAKRLISGARA